MEYGGETVLQNERGIVVLNIVYSELEVDHSMYMHTIYITLIRFRKLLFS